MRTGSHAQAGAASATSTTPAYGPELRESTAIAELFLGVFRRDLATFFPRARVLQIEPGITWPDRPSGSVFRLLVDEIDQRVSVDLFGLRYGVEPFDGRRFSEHDIRMIKAIGAVLGLRHHHLFQIDHPSRLELFRGGSEDHYVAAFVEPWAYSEISPRPSRIASTIQTLRTAALSTYENRRVSTGALLLGSDQSSRPVCPDALPYGVELTALKSIHRLCDGKRTVYLVDIEGRLIEVVDIARWAESIPPLSTLEVPCARDYTAHARSTRYGGNLCLVLSPNQEIKLFAGGSQQFAYSHGRWRILDPWTKFAIWSSALEDQRLARVLFQTALDLAECRQGGLFVVIDEPAVAVGRLIAPHDILAIDQPTDPPNNLNPGDPLAKRALHYLARGRSIADLDPSVLEAFAALDGAIATDRSGRLLAYGAILRHDASGTISPAVEGARTTAAMIASRFGPVLKVSEDGIVSCFLGGTRVWDL
ncbi:hypothetical protein P12x_004059 [Tundrisphaera lichenicola]|uniref:hypothetical protein n=1 Tax=Tundrisphaera lichenicola TaxID=2029860 RepID=UPI003EBF3A19